MVKRGKQKKGKKVIEDLWATVDSMGEIDKGMRLRNEKCRIPQVQSLPPEKNKHDDMNNCHVTGSKFLGLIRKGSRLLTWQLGPHHMGHLTVKEITNQMEDGRWPGNYENLIPKPARFSPSRARDDDCKYTVACHQHDDSIWKPIDKTDIDFKDSKTQFLLGYRSVISLLAWYNGAKLWAREDLPDDPQVRRNLLKYPILEPLIDQAQQLARTGTNTDRTIESELDRWTSIYRNSAWDRITTIVHEVECKVPIAGTGSWRPHLRNQTFATILPTRSVQKDKKHVLLVSQATPALPLVRNLYRKSLERTSRELANGFSDEKLLETLLN